MTVPNVDTFEHDIHEELKNKEASITDIASATGVVGNIDETPVPAQRSNIRVIILSCIVLLLLAGFGGGAYWYLAFRNAEPQKKETMTPVTSTPTEVKVQENVPTLLNMLSPYLSQGISTFATKVDMTPFGTAITIRDYRYVFSYMVSHEQDIARDMLAGTYDTASAAPTFTFTDISESNQNMRMTEAGSSTLYYAFIDESHLVFATSTTGIIALRNMIIQ